MPFSLCRNEVECILDAMRRGDQPPRRTLRSFGRQQAVASIRDVLDDAMDHSANAAEETTARSVFAARRGIG